MSEMLANHYFLVRNFISAKSILESIIEKEPNNLTASKKLIICFVATAEVDKALKLFYKVIKTNIELIINTKIDSEDCPCPEIINEVDSKDNFFKSDREKTIALGILWAYCNIEKSIEYFKKVEMLNTENDIIKNINSILSNKLFNIKQNTLN